MTPTTQTDTRERILAAAIEAIALKSFNGCGLSEILQAAGVPKGSFYHYFRSKEDLGIAVVERARDEAAEVVDPIVGDRRRPALERMRGIFAAYRDEIAQGGLMHGCVIGKMALEAADLSEPVRAAVKQAYDQWGSILARLIREAQAENAVDVRLDPEQTANLLVNLWEGTLIRARIDRSLAPVDAAIAYVFDRGFLGGRL